MFTNETTGLSLPVFCADMISHSSLSAGPGWFATSAGFFDLARMEASGESDSLHLKPCPTDQEILQLVISGLESIIFSYQDIFANLARVKEVKKARETGREIAPQNSSK